MSILANASGRRILLGTTATWLLVSPFAAASGGGGGGGGVVAADGFGPGVYGPSTVYMTNHDINYPAPSLGTWFARLETGGPQVWSLTGADAAGFYLAGPGGASIFPQNGGSAYNKTGIATFAVTLNVTDGTTTKTKSITIQNVVNVVQQGTNLLYNTAPTGGQYGSGFNDPHIARMSGFGFSTALNTFPYNTAPTFTDPNGLMQLDTYSNQTIANLASAWPLTSRYGAYTGATIGITVGGTTYTEPFPYWIVEEQPAAVAFKPVGTLYDYLQPGDRLGTIQAFCDVGVASLVPLSSDGTIGIGKTGIVTVTGALSGGVKSFTLRVTSNNGKVTDKVISYTIQAGTALAASNMTLTVPTTLDNYVFNQAIGTPAISGISGTKVWSISNEDDCVGIYNGGTDLSMFLIDPSTGAITTRNQLPNRTHVITVTCTSGATRCRQNFNIPVAWRAGPTFYVGQGMVAAHGAGVGFEHMTDIMGLFQSVDIGPTNAGATVIIAPNSDPDYYAADNVSGHETFPSNYGLRFGLHGPVKFVGANPNGPRPRMGGAVSSPSGGAGEEAKAYFAFASGDCVLDGIEVSFVQGVGNYDDNSHGLSGVRKDADVWGDATFKNCFIHDCNNGIESGNGPYRTILDRNILANNGTASVSGGATHGIYCGACTWFIATNNLWYNTIYGHDVKTRAKNGSFTGNRVYDGERGSCSCLIDICEGGNYLIDGNQFHKGPNLQNPFAIQYGEEDYTDPNGNHYRKNSLTVSNNTISMMSIFGTQAGPPVAISPAGILSWLDGTGVQANITGNSFFLAQSAAKIAHNPYGDQSDLITITETGSVILTMPPALDFSDPTSHSPAAARVGNYNWTTDGGGGYQHFSTVQMDAGSDDIRVSHSAAAGTVLGTCVAAGSKMYANVSPTDPGIQPFTSGTTYALTQDGEYFGNAPWAPVGRYAVSTTGVLTVAGTLPAAGSVDFIKVRATAPGGTLCDHRFYVAVI